MINLNEAPEGFITVEPIEYLSETLAYCGGCWFFIMEEDCSSIRDCIGKDRKDGESVIFIKKAI